MTTDLTDIPKPCLFGVEVLTLTQAEHYGIDCWNAAIEAAARECEEAHTNYPRERELNRIYAKAIRDLTKGTTT
jgi:hypothetical protein